MRDMIEVAANSLLLYLIIEDAFSFDENTVPRQCLQPMSVKKLKPEAISRILKASAITTRPPFTTFVEVPEYWLLISRR